METTHTLRITTDLKERMQKQADKESAPGAQVSLSAVFRVAAEQYLKRKERKKG